MGFVFNQNNANILVCNEKSIENIRHHVKLLTMFLKECSRLTESYILDYFVEELWTYLPASWLKTVMKFESSDLAEFLDSEKQIKNRNPLPLSLLAFRACAFTLALSRKPVKTLKNVEKFISEDFPSVCKPDNISWNNLDSAYEDKSGQHRNIPEFCRRHVKPKKQHEIFRMGQLAATVLESFGIKHAIDIGSGQGHLSRFLALCYNLNVTTVEAEQSHVSTAAHFDRQALLTMKNLKAHLNIPSKLESSCDTDVLPHHVEGSMTVQTSKRFLNKIFKQENEDVGYDFKESSALLGLHTCGDLATTILKMFVECPEFKVLLSVGCCYMKNASDLGHESYPMSSYVNSLPNHHLSYEAKEMACHALEMYIQRLKEDIPSLKIHCYRATLEKCIVLHYPNKKHMGLRGVKHAENLPFPLYAERALSKVSCSIPEITYSSPEIQSCLDKWKEVLIFYSLRLIIAPVIESLILLDRMLFLYEHGYPSCLVPLFDPSISPRNYVIVSACRNIHI